jgi:glutamate carboxypeptidase
VDDLVERLRARTPELLEALRELVEIESPTADPDACRACASAAERLAERLLEARPERLERGGRVHLRLRFGGAPRVLLVGHLDTVWPLGTVRRWRFEVRDGRASGPGVFDMKAGVVQLLYALEAQRSLDGVAVLLTTDEEWGAPTSRPLIEETAAGVEAALVLEPSAAGALKTARKGVAVYELTAQGRAAHAGLDPEKGANAAVELAHQVVAAAALARPERGTTVTPSILAAGSATNTVPAEGSAQVDVRAWTTAEAERVAAGLAALRPVLPGTSVGVTARLAIPPLERGASEALFARARRLAAALGLPALEEVSVGGGSDGSLLAGLGVQVLDGLGAVGDRAHAEGEYVLVDALAERTALVAALVDELRR